MTGTSFEFCDTVRGTNEYHIDHNSVKRKKLDNLFFVLFLFSEMVPHKFKKNYLYVIDNETKNCRFFLYCLAK